MQLFGLFTVASSGHLSFREEKRPATVCVVLLREDRNLPGLLSSAPVAAGDTLVRSWSLSGPISNPHHCAGAERAPLGLRGPALDKHKTSQTSGHRTAGRREPGTQIHSNQPPANAVRGSEAWKRKRCGEVNVGSPEL